MSIVRLTLLNHTLDGTCCILLSKWCSSHIKCKGVYYLSIYLSNSIRVVVKIMVPFGAPITIRHLLFRVPKKGPNFAHHPYTYTRFFSYMLECTFQPRVEAAVCGTAVYVALKSTARRSVDVPGGWHCSWCVVYRRVVSRYTGFAHEPPINHPSWGLSRIEYEGIRRRNRLG